MRALGMVILTACYVSAPPPSEPPPAQHDHDQPPVRTDPPRAPRSALRCPAQSELQLDGNHDTATCQNKDNGRNDGPRTVYYPDGTIAAEEHWQDGGPAGTWRTFYPNGKPSHEREFRDGQEQSHRAWDDLGKPRALPALVDSHCASDADCTMGMRGPECCPPPNFCGEIVSRAHEKSLEDRCAGYYCGRPVPSSSCMGMRGVVPKCVNGSCGR
jgi:hypothetical protein